MTKNKQIQLPRALTVIRGQIQIAAIKQPPECPDFAKVNVQHLKAKALVHKLPITVVSWQSEVYAADETSWRHITAYRHYGNGLVPAKVVSEVSSEDCEWIAEQDPTTTKEDTSESEAQPQTPPHHHIKYQSVDSLKPNNINASLFTTSLAEESVQRLADELQRDGHIRQPIEVRSDGVILDGERRWRAAQVLGWEEVPVFMISGVETDEEVQSYILRAHSTQRDATVEEQVRLFKLAKDVIKRERGRPPGRPKKDLQTEGGFLSPEAIEAEAASMAGFSSAGVATKAGIAIRKGDQALIAKLNTGEVSINQAYNKLKKPKLPKVPKSEATTVATSYDSALDLDPHNPDGGNTNSTQTIKVSVQGPEGSSGRDESGGIEPVSYSNGECADSDNSEVESEVMKDGGTAASTVGNHTNEADYVDAKGSEEHGQAMNREDLDAIVISNPASEDNKDPERTALANVLLPLLDYLEQNWSNPLAAQCIDEIISQSNEPDEVLTEVVVHSISAFEKPSHVAQIVIDALQKAINSDWRSAG